MIFLKRFKRYNSVQYLHTILTDITNYISYPIINDMSYGYRLQIVYTGSLNYINGVEYTMYGLFLSSIKLDRSKFIDVFYIEQLYWKKNTSLSRLCFRIKFCYLTELTDIEIITPVSNNLLKIYPIISKTLTRRFTVKGGIKIENC
jgi:hypothetical protein